MLVQTLPALTAAKHATCSRRHASSPQEGPDTDASGILAPPHGLTPVAPDPCPTKAAQIQMNDWGVSISQSFRLQNHPSFESHRSRPENNAFDEKPPVAKLARTASARVVRIDWQSVARRFGDEPCKVISGNVAARTDHPDSRTKV